MHKQLRIPSVHRLADLLVYAVFGVIGGVFLFIMIQWARGYSVALPAMPTTDVLPVEIAGTTAVHIK